MAKRAITKARGKKNGAAEPSPEGLNGIDPARLRGYLDSLHELADDYADKSSRLSGRYRGQRNGVYDAAVKELNIPKTIIKLDYERERAERKFEAKVREMNPREAEALERCGQAFGDNPMGEWATRMAKLAAEANADSETPVMDTARA